MRLGRSVFVMALAAGLAAGVGAVAPSPAAAMVTHSNLAPVDVATTSTDTVAAPSAGTIRRLLILQNDSDTAIYCTTDGTAAVVGKGIRLNAGGGVFLSDTAVPAGAVKCIHGGSGTKKLMPTTGE